MTETDILRAQTKAFIDADAKAITLARRNKVSNGSGGYDVTYVPLMTPQTLRLIPQHGNMSPLRETLDGEAVQPDYILLGEWNADISRWDTFTDNGRRYIVLFVHEKATYEKKGEVKYLGEA
jgi:hypothetical protein